MAKKSHWKVARSSTLSAREITLDGPPSASGVRRVTTGQEKPFSRFQSTANMPDFMPNTNLPLTDGAKERAEEVATLLQPTLAGLQKIGLVRIFMDKNQPRLIIALPLDVWNTDITLK